MIAATKSEWFILDSPVGEPEYNWDKFHGKNKYHIQRFINEDDETIWFGINVNWKKEKNGPWTVLSENPEAKPLEKYLPDIVYGGDRIVWNECEMPIYEQLYINIHKK